jgi:hypothetical protein
MRNGFGVCWIDLDSLVLFFSENVGFLLLKSKADPEDHYEAQQPEFLW